jgi:hypothetical protein
MHVRQWSAADFDAMSWHDCHVHGLRISEGEHGTGELELDIDYIAEWRRDKERLSFVLVPSMLRFHGVCGLRVALDWLGPCAALGPFSLDRIERTVEQRANYTATLWRLGVNWPAGSLEFEATGFTQEAWGNAVVSGNQVLTRSERVAA